MIFDLGFLIWMKKMTRDGNRAPEVVARVENAHQLVFSCLQHWWVTVTNQGISAMEEAFLAAEQRAIIRHLVGTEH
jgi:hypothetical protein